MPLDLKETNERIDKIEQELNTTNQKIDNVENKLTDFSRTLISVGLGAIIAFIAITFKV